MKRGLVLTGGEQPSEMLLKNEIAWADDIICADSGFDLIADNIPDKLKLVIGDFDSTERSAYLQRLNVPVEALPPMKNETDTEMAMMRMLELKPEEIHLLGGTGSRLDHSLATVFSLETYLDKGTKIVLINDDNHLCLANEGQYTVNKDAFKYFSLIPLTDTAEVSTDGFAYEVDRLILQRKKTRGVSNEIKNKQGIVTIHRGICLMIKSKDK